MFAPLNTQPALTGPSVRTVDDERRDLLRAAIMKGAPPAQVDLVCAISRRYGLDPLLQHVVLIDGRPYVTHKGLMHLAHASGRFDGMETTFGEDGGGAWAECVVHRKDMARPFRARIYLSEYNKGRGAWATHPRAMAAKTVESFCLRRAFDVSLVSQEEMGRGDPAAAEVAEREALPPGHDSDWKEAAQAFSAAVAALSPDDRRALKTELTARHGHCDFRRFTADELDVITAEIYASDS
ncbi:MAG: recombinase RecT [Armatimonadetes bacterium]|nr:recombinase RecT [Armatimonadota bacterium]